MSEQCRFLTPFTFNTAQVLRAYDGVGSADVTIGIGTYWFAPAISGISNFMATFEAAWDAAFTTTISLDICGVDQDVAGAAQGRLLFDPENSGTVLLWEHASTTLDERILGWTKADITLASGVTASAHVHRFGWYPNARLSEPFVRLFGRGVTDRRVGGTVKSLRTDGASRRFQADLVVEKVPAALARIKAGEEEDYASAARLTSPSGSFGADPNAAFEAFVEDTLDGKWYVFPDVADATDYRGPFAYPADAVVRRFPLGEPSRLAERQGETWNVVVPGRTWIA